MAVVTSTFSVSANTNWISTTWAVGDPSYKVNTQLVDWVTAINNPTKIEITLNPGNATNKATTSDVNWILRMREGDTSTDYGIVYKSRYGNATGSTATTLVGSYNNRTAGTVYNNGYGLMTTLTGSTATENFTTNGTVLTAYEATGSTPWFLYAWENAGRTLRRMDLILGCDTTNIVAGSYYPSTGLGKWIYVMSPGNSASIYTPQNSYLAPYKGINSSISLRHPSPTATFGNNYFFRLSSQYGNNHYLGDVTNDILVSNTTTGQFGDTMTLNSITYTCIGNMASAVNYWVKTSA